MRFLSSFFRFWVGEVTGLQILLDPYVSIELKIQEKLFACGIFIALIHIVLLFVICNRIMAMNRG